MGQLDCPAIFCTLSGIATGINDKTAIKKYFLVRNKMYAALWLRPKILEATWTTRVWVTKIDRTSDGSALRLLFSCPTSASYIAYSNRVLHSSRVSHVACSAPNQANTFSCDMTIRSICVITYEFEAWERLLIVKTTYESAWKVTKGRNKF